MNGYKVLLFLVLFGVGIAMYVAVSFGHKLDQELAQIKQLAKQNHELSMQLSREQDSLQQSNDQQTTYLQCLLASQNLGIFPGGCASPVTPLTPSTTAIVTPTSSPAVTPTPLPQAAPTPSPKSIIPGKAKCTLNLLGLCI